MDKIELARKYNISNKTQLATAIAVDILHKEYRPIHYRDSLFKECHEIYKDSKKTQGPSEAFRQIMGNEKNNFAKVINGYICWKAWEESDPLNLYIPPTEPIVINILSEDWRLASKDSELESVMKKSKHKKELILNSYAAEYATRRFLIESNANIKKKINKLTDFLMYIGDRIYYCDVKSFFTKRISWKIANINPNITYIFTSKILDEDKIEIYGFQYGRFIALNLDGRIDLNSICDIRYILGKINYEKFRQNIKPISRLPFKKKVMGKRMDKYARLRKYGQRSFSDLDSTF